MRVADIEALNTEPDVIQGCKNAETVKHEEPTVNHDNVDLLSEVQQLREAVGVLAQAVPLSDSAALKIMGRGDLS